MSIRSAPIQGLPEGHVSIGAPSIDDGAECWRLAVESEVLDANSRYAYLLWCRDFSGTSLVARLDGAVAGFVTGYRRPDEPGTLVIWQVAVAAQARGRRIASDLLDALCRRLPDVDHLETTITPDNAASQRLFTGFARSHRADIHCSELFSSELLGGGHLPEMLYRIGPIEG
jgi:L-2,4-diaminobutyric acid acetyltransferase